MDQPEDDDLSIAVPGADDVVIAIMGVTGSGKSTLVSLLVDEDVPVGHSLESCTMSVTMYNFTHRGRRIFLIDTPGFDDGTRDNIDILKEVAYFLTQLYRRHVRLSGLVYLQRITDLRMGGSSLRSLSIFKSICGEHGFGQVVLTTTMWSLLQDMQIGRDREAQLIRTEGWWGDMYRQGSAVLRHTGNKESALQVIERLMDSRRTFSLAIQIEMVHEGRALADTSAGREVNKTFLELKRKLNEEMAELQASFEQALRDRDQTLKNTLIQQRHELEDKIYEATLAQRGLKITLDRLTAESDERYTKLLAEFEQMQQNLQKIIDNQVVELETLRLQSQEDLERYHRVQTTHEREREELQSLIVALEKERQAESARRVRAELELKERNRARKNTAFQAQQNQKLSQEKQLEKKIVQLKIQKRTLLKKIAPYCGLLAGVGLLAAGIGTMMPPLILAGATLMGSVMPLIGEKKEKE